MKKFLLLSLAAIFAFSAARLSMDASLKASEDDGVVTAVEQQEAKKESAPTVEVTVPEKKEEAPAVKVEETKAEEPKAEEKPAEVKAEEPKAEPAAEEKAPEQESAAVTVSEPAETVEAPIAEAPAAEETVVEEADPTEAPIATPEPSVYTVEVRLVNKGDIYFGDKVTLKAVIKGDLPDGAELHWERNDGEHGWKTIKNEKKETYSFIVDEKNAEYDYRVVIQEA